MAQLFPSKGKGKIKTGPREMGAASMKGRQKSVAGGSMLGRQKSVGKEADMKGRQCGGY